MTQTPEKTLRLNSEPFTGWQDISTAPKDGTNILVWWPLQFHCPLVAHWNDGKWNNNKIGWKFTAWDNSPATEPEAWMPLPPAPSPEQKGHPND